MATTNDTANDNRIKRGQAAQILGTSYASVRRLEGKTLFPSQDARGVWWFLESEVRELARKQTEPTAKLAETCDGETAAKAFDMFDAGDNPADVVKALRIHPSVARELHREWADMRGGFFVGAEIATKVSAMPCCSHWYPVSNAEELVEVLESASIEQCRTCEREDANICITCALKNRSAVVQFVRAREAKYAELARRAAERKTRLEAARKAAKQAEKRPDLRSA